MTMTEEQIDTITPQKLDGLVVECKGLAMLAKLKDGDKYRMEYFKSRAYGDCVTFYKPKGKKPIVHHSAWSVISSIHACSNGYLNGLKLV